MWDRIKGLIVEEDPNKPAEAPVAAPAPTPAAPRRLSRGTTSVIAVSEPQKVAPAVTLNEGMVETIRSGVFKRETALSALLRASESLEDVIPDPVMRLKAAQRMVGGGKSAKEFTDAVELHLRDVDGEQKNFKNAVEGAAQSKVGALKAQQDQCQQIVARSNAELDTIAKREEELNGLVQQNTARAAELENEIATEEANLQRVEQEFELAAQTVREELLEQKETILSSLT